MREKLGMIRFVSVMIFILVSSLSVFAVPSRGDDPMLSGEDARFLCESIVVFDKLGSGIISFTPPVISREEEPRIMLAKMETYLKEQVVTYDEVRSYVRELKQVVKSKDIVRHLENMDSSLTQISLAVSGILKVMEKIGGSVERLVTFQEEWGLAFAESEKVFAEIDSRSLTASIREKQWTIARKYVESE